MKKKIEPNKDRGAFAYWSDFKGEYVTFSHVLEFECLMRIKKMKFYNDFSHALIWFVAIR